MDEVRQVSYYGLPLKYVVLEAAGQAQPPLDYLVGAALHRLGLAGSDWYVRLPAAMFGAGGVLLLGLLVRRIGGGKASVIAAALLAVCPLHVAMSQEARPYTIFFFFAMATTLAYIRARENAALRRWILFGGLLLCMLLTRWVGPHVVALCLAAHAVAAKLAAGRSADDDARRMESRRFTAAIVSFLAAYVVYNPIFGLIYALDKGFAATRAGQVWSVRAADMLRGTFESITGINGIAPMAGEGFAQVLRWIMCLAACVGVMLLLRAVLRGEARRNVPFVVVALAFPFAYTAIYVTLTWFPAKPQYLLPASATFCTAAAICVVEAGRLLARRRPVSIAAALLLFGVFAGPMAAASLRESQTIRKPDWRGALTHLRMHADADDALVSIRSGGVRMGAGSDIIGAGRYLQRDLAWLHLNAATNVEVLDTPRWTGNDNTLWILCNAAPYGATLVAPPENPPQGTRVHTFCRLFLLEISPGARADKRLIDAIASLDASAPDGAGLVAPDLLRAQYLARRADVAGTAAALAAARRQCRTDADIAVVNAFLTPPGRIATLGETQD